MFKKEIEFPRELCLVKGQPAGDRMSLVCAGRGVLNLGDEGDCLFLVLVTHLFGFFFVDVEQLPVAEVFLDNDAGVAVDGVNLWNWNLTIQEETRYVEIRMEFGVECLGIDGGDSGAFLPADAVILARRGIGS